MENKMESEIELNKWRQSMFNQAYFGLWSQGFARSASATGACQYRGELGLKCAVGHLVSDGDLDGFEGNISLMPNKCQSRLGIVGFVDFSASYKFSFLKELQAAHDLPLGSSGRKQELEAVAAKWKLSVPDEFTLWLQKHFSKAYIGLANQGFKKAAIGSSCLYRTEEGLKCAVGHLISDEAAQRATGTVFNLPLNVVNEELDCQCEASDFFGSTGQVVGLKNERLRKLRDLQQVHDNSISPNSMKNRLEDFARENGLFIPVFDPPDATELKPNPKIEISQQAIEVLAVAPVKAEDVVKPLAVESKPVVNDVELTDPAPKKKRLYQKKLSLQEIFNIVYLGLKGQDFRQAINGPAPSDWCVFEAPNGDKCAIGHILSSADRKTFNNVVSDVGELEWNTRRKLGIDPRRHVGFLINLGIPSVRLLEELQRAHDHGTTKESMESRLAEAAQSFGLSIPK